MKQLIEKAKELETPQIIIYGVCAICLIIILYGVFSGGDDDTEQSSQVSNLELPEDGKPVTNYDTKMEAYGVKEEKESGIDLTFDDGFFGGGESEQDSLDRIEKLNQLNTKIDSIEGKNNTGHYGEEDDEIIKNLQKEIEEEPKSYKPVRRAPSASYSSKPKLTYEERLEKARASRLGSKSNGSKKSVNIIETRAAIFRDQFKLPGELVELVLTKDFRYNGKTFKKGTLLYADMNINKTRVLFNITNIAHQPIVMEVRDIRDGRIGMYSSRAGELWDKYQSEALNETTDGAANEISSSTGSRILSGSLNAISSFFQKKRMKKNDKIMLLNDQELIINIIEKNE